MGRCIWDGMPCDCNEVEAFVNCPKVEQNGFGDYDDTVLDEGEEGELYDGDAETGSYPGEHESIHEGKAVA